MSAGIACHRPWLWVSLLCVGCTGQIGSLDEGRGPSTPGPTGPGPGDGAGAAMGAAASGWVGLHRLNNAEYGHTVRDLLGVTATSAASFIADEKAAGFDNIASALGMTAAQYEQYFQSADLLVEDVWADASLRGRIVTCTPASASEVHGCAEQILRPFGLRAYRRPLATDELERLVAVVDAAVALGEPFERGIAQAVKASLSSPSFLYRVELDGDPGSPNSHPLTAHELASRLSYFLWSTMPDARLFDRARDGSLLEPATLLAEVDRMLDDPGADRFVEGFAGQWLGLRALRSHQVDTDVLPMWSDSLREAMIAEGLRYFDEFLHGPRGMDTFFTADVSFVDVELAGLYGYQGGPFDPDVAHTEPTDARRGFLGLASFLTASSFSYRTAPTLRGKWVLENLLCTEIPPPPGDVPQLDDATAEAAARASQNVRDRLAAHREDPTCAGCHRILDPIGLGLERFDAIGAYRERYANGDVIDPSGELPGGARFDGLQELSALLAADPRLIECASEKLATYALGRELTGGDAPYLDALRDQWTDDGLGLRALIERIVLSDLFRMRRGEAPR